MIDADLDYCDQQIEAQTEKVQAVHAAIQHNNQDIIDADNAVKAAREERKRVGQMHAQLEHKWANEKRILGEMRAHRKQLKLLKTILKKQNKMIDEQKHE